MYVRGLRLVEGVLPAPDAASYWEGCLLGQISWEACWRYVRSIFGEQEFRSRSRSVFG